MNNSWILGNPDMARARIEVLTKQINYYNDLYYNKDISEISNEEWDAMMQELKALETAFPKFTDSNSPTQRVGGQANSSFAKVKHEIQMNSLKDVFSTDDVCDFVRKIKDETEIVPSFSVEPKIDGLSVSLIYENGKLTVGSTRGDGYIGEDVTANLKTIGSVPHTIRDNSDILEVRGECYMSKASFEQLIKSQIESGEDPAKNARNAAAGALRQKNAEITKNRKLGIFIFNLQQIKSNTTNFSDHISAMNYLDTLGFTTIPRHVCTTEKEILNVINEIGELRSRLPYDIDGVVIKVNNFDLRENLGANSKTPNWAVAYKFPPEEKSTVLKNIELQVGRTGRVTPVAIFDPIDLAGTKVTKATLHNQAFIQNKNIDIGDKIIVRKSGDIIPEVVRCEAKNGDNYYEIPKICPCCAQNLMQVNADLVCTNPECGEKIIRMFMHFVSKPAMNIVGMGEAVIRQLVEKGRIKYLWNIYQLTFDDLIKLDGFKEKSANKLLKAIEDSKTRGLANVLCALGIPNVGKEAAKLLAEKYKDIDSIIFASVEDLASIESFGETTAKSICNYMHILDNYSTINSLRTEGVDMTSHAKSVSTSTGAFSGKTIVITGTLPTMKRDKAEKLIIENGGKVSNSVSKKTNYLLAGDKAGSKLDKARSLGIKIISEDDLLREIKEYEDKNTMS